MKEVAELITECACPYVNELRELAEAHPDFPDSGVKGIQRSHKPKCIVLPLPYSNTSWSLAIFEIVRSFCKVHHNATIKHGDAFGANNIAIHISSIDSSMEK